MGPLVSSLAATSCINRAASQERRTLKNTMDNLHPALDFNLHAQMSLETRHSFESKQCLRSSRVDGSARHEHLDEMNHFSFDRGE
jgi:hypothetical protein